MIFSGRKIRIECRNALRSRNKMYAVVTGVTRSFEKKNSVQSIVIDTRMEIPTHDRSIGST